MEYVEFDRIPDEEKTWHGILELHGKIFGSADSLAEELQTKSGLFILVAADGEKVVGYKIGYERKKGHFYSRLGGVDPTYRKRGIASELMRRQHEWCKQNGYRSIRTHTKNKWRDMLILNLRHGFDIIGTFTDDKGEPKIILEKRF